MDKLAEPMACYDKSAFAKKITKAIPGFASCFAYRKENFLIYRDDSGDVITFIDVDELLDSL
jgi:hypothetical protein